MVSGFTRVSKSRKFIFLTNIAMLLLALWMIGDQVFDGLQSYTYFIYSQFWNKKWHHQDKANSTISSGMNVTHCDEASLAKYWDYIHITMANYTESIMLQTPCGTWNTTTQTIALNCKLRLNEAYFACSLACWFLPPIAFGSLLTFMKYKVGTYHWNLAYLCYLKTKHLHLCNVSRLTNSATIVCFKNFRLWNHCSYKSLLNTLTGLICKQFPYFTLIQIHCGEKLVYTNG